MSGLKRLIYTFLLVRSIWGKMHDCLQSNNLISFKYSIMLEVVLDTIVTKSNILLVFLCCQE